MISGFAKDTSVNLAASLAASFPKLAASLKIPAERLAASFAASFREANSSNSCPATASLLRRRDATDHDPSAKNQRFSTGNKSRPPVWSSAKSSPVIFPTHMSAFAGRPWQTKTFISSFSYRVLSAMKMQNRLPDLSSDPSKAALII